MNNDGKLYIVITDQRPGDSTPTAPETPNKPQKKKKDDGQIFKDFAKHKFFNFVEGQVQQFVNYEIENIGNFTGNYVAQREVQSMFSTINGLQNIIVSGWGGLIASGGNPIGALIGAGFAIASQTINYFEGQRANLMQFKRQEYSIEMLRQRSGLYALENGSRTGDW